MNPTEINENQIKLWKQQHGEIFKVEADGLVGYLKKPDRKTLSYVTSVKDIIKANETLINNCWLGGDELLKTSDEYFFGLCQKLGELVKIKEVELAKL